MKRKANQGAPRASNRTRLSPQQARETILQAAEEEFAAAGFGGARADRIAERAKVNKALPFYYFGSKSELYAEVLTRAMNRVWSQIVMLAPVAAGNTRHLAPIDRLRLFVQNVSNLLATDRNWLRLMVREITDTPERARDFGREFVQPLLAAADTRLRDDMAAGKIIEFEPLQIIISVMSEVFFYFLLVPILEGLGLEDPLSPQNLANREQAIIQLLYRALRGPAIGDDS